MSIINFYLDNDLRELDEKFMRAAIRGDVDEAVKIIDEDPSVVNFQDETTGVTGLMVFVSNGCGSMVDHICDVPCADVTIEDKFGRSAGLLAIGIGRPDIGERIDQRLRADILAFDPDFFDDGPAVESPDSKVVRFTRPKGGSDPSP